MKFTVERTVLQTIEEMKANDWLDYPDDTPPCSGAVMGEDNKWYIEIFNVDEILVFVQENGKIVIMPPGHIDDFALAKSGELPHIEIYNTYRE